MVRVITDVTTEPITLSEAKEHCRIDSNDLETNITVVQSITGGFHTSATLTGISTSVADYQAIVLLESVLNSASATVDVTIYESDDNTTFTLWTAGGTFAQITTANDTVNYEVAYTGLKDYIRAVAVVTGDSNFAVSIIKSSPYSIEDTYISSLITAARQYVENYQNRALATQTLELILDNFPNCDQIELPYSPLQSVTSIKYVDSIGTSAIMTAGLSGYLVDVDSEPGKIYLAYGQIFPTDELQPYAGIKIRYIAGYTGTTPDIIPKSTKQAMLMLISHWYENRTILNLSNNINKEIELTVTSLLYQNRLFSL